MPVTRSFKIYNGLTTGSSNGSYRSVKAADTYKEEYGKNRSYGASAGGIV